MKNNSKNSSAGPNKSGLWRGTFLCAGFTFRQQWKIKANLISFLILTVFAIALPYLYSAGFDAGSSYGISDVEKIYYLDGVGAGEPDFKKLQDENDELVNTEFEYIALPAKDTSVSEIITPLLDNLGSKEVLLTVNNYSGELIINVTRSADTEISEFDAEDVGNLFSPVVSSYMIAKSGISEEVREKLSEYAYTVEYDAEEYQEALNGYGDSAENIGTAPDEVTDSGENDEEVYDVSDEDDFMDTYSLQYPFSFVIMMISVLAASFIIREVVSEKSSKLIDTLLVGMKAQSLLFGKILGILGYVISMAVGVGAAFGISDLIRKNITGESAIASFLSSYGEMMKNAGVSAVLVLIVTSLFGILVFSLLTGLVGAGCSTEEDTASALGLPMIIMMAAYMISIMAPLFGDNIVRILSVIPFLSTFLAPVQYLCGTIGIAVVVISWLLQGAAAVLLVWVSGNIYSSLLIYRGKRLGFFKMMRMAFPKRKGARS